VAKAFGRDAFRLTSFEQALVAKRVHAPSKAAAAVEYREANGSALFVLRFRAHSQLQPFLYQAGEGDVVLDGKRLGLGQKAVVQIE
jgi:hypothetical protein